MNEEQYAGFLRINADLSGQILRAYQQIEKTNIRLDETERQLEATNRRLDATERRLDQTNKQLDATIVQLDKTNKRLDATEKRLDKTIARLDETSQRLDATIARLDETEKRLDARITSLETTMNLHFEAIYDILSDMAEEISARGLVKKIAARRARAFSEAKSIMKQASASQAVQ